MVVSKFLNIFKTLLEKHPEAIRLKLIKAFTKPSVLGTQGKAGFNVNPQASRSMMGRNGARYN